MKTQLSSQSPQSDVTAQEAVPDMPAASPPSKSSPYKWPIVALIFPQVGLFLIVVLQIVVRSTVTKNGANATVSMVLNIFSAVMGVLCVVILLLAPVWLILVSRGEKEREAQRRASMGQQ